MGAILCTVFILTPFNTENEKYLANLCQRKHSVLA